MIDIKLPDAAWDGVQDGAEAIFLQRGIAFYQHTRRIQRRLADKN